MILKLWAHLSKQRQKQFVILLVLMIVASFSEIISIGAVLPFLAVLVSPEHLFQHQLMRPVIDFLGLAEPTQLVLPLTVLFIISALFAGAVRLLLLYIMTRFAFATGADLSINIYRRTLYQDYAIHIARNSSEIINGIISKTNTVIGGIISPLLTLISSIFIIIAIIIVLFAINPIVAVVASFSFGGLYWVVVYYTRHHLQENSRRIAEKSTKMIKSLQEGLGGIRDVLIDGTQEFYCQLYRNADLPMRRASGINVFIAGSPRFAMEAVGMILIAVLAYTMSLYQDDLTTAIPVLGALALGAQRLLPALQQAYSSFSIIKGSHESFIDVLELLDQPLPNHLEQPKASLIEFQQEICIKNLSFRYDDNGPWVLDKINLVVSKGSRVGFIGKTGSGKSTLLDVIMGLLPLTHGEFFIDSQQITDQNRRSWQAHIAHVPQNIYLSDSSIEENIAFGILPEKINHQLVIKAAKQAQIEELIEGWPEKYRTFVGERGVRLSGGQRQRIGIARALYKQANVLIFDEATSALDNKTEQDVMEAIEGLERDLTILIIAHRLTTLKGCDSVIELENGKITHSMKYKEII
jgi:ATP-binding cassette, subfamily B, bacterial PglK